MILGAAAGRGPSRLRLLAACLAVGCVVAALHFFRPPLLARADLAVYDRLLAVAPLRAPSGTVALVEVDERSLAEAGRWPWPRDRVAELLDRIRALGAVAVGLDILFSEPDAGGEAPGAPRGRRRRPRSRRGTRRSRPRSDGDRSSSATPSRSTGPSTASASSGPSASRAPRRAAP